MADEYLRNFIRSATEPERDGELSITINTSGLVITGRVVSESRYMEEMANVYSGDGPEEEEVRIGFEEWFGISAERRDESTRYVHLLDAKIMRALGGPITLPAWRGQLDSIVGFALGGLDA